MRVGGSRAASRLLPRLRVRVAQGTSPRLGLGLGLGFATETGTPTRRMTTEEIPRAMRAVRIEPPGSGVKDPLALGAARTYDAPRADALKEGEVIVRNVVAGVNFIDAYLRSGLYANPTGLLGVEGGGVVVAGGASADARGLVGRRVAYCMASGAYAEYAVVPASKCVVVPEDVPLGLALGFMTQGLTAHYLTSDCAAGVGGRGPGRGRGRGLGPDSWVLVHAAGSGTGNLVAQVASRVWGANVVGTCSPEKAARAIERGGCKHVVDYTDKKDLVARLRALTPGGAGFDVVYDGVGKDTWETSFAAVRARGLVVFFGNASGPVPPIDPLSLTARGSLYVTRPSLAHYVADPDELRERFADVVSWHRRGVLRIDADRAFPLDEVGRAHAELEAGKSKGKMIIVVGDARDPSVAREVPRL